jgi:hypothetical protein
MAIAYISLRAKGTMPGFREKDFVMKKPNGTELTLKQQRFANEYCVDLNATAAYRRAGYNAEGNAAEACASRLLSNAQVQQAIQEKEKIAAKRLEVNTENVLRATSDWPSPIFASCSMGTGPQNLSKNSITKQPLLFNLSRSAR